MPGRESSPEHPVGVFGLAGKLKKRQTNGAKLANLKSIESTQDALISQTNEDFLNLAETRQPIGLGGRILAVRIPDADGNQGSFSSESKGAKQFIGRFEPREFVVTGLTEVKEKGVSKACVTVTLPNDDYAGYEYAIPIDEPRTAIYPDPVSLEKAQARHKRISELYLHPGDH